MSCRLLIVDDDAAIRAALAERFVARGYAVTQAPTGAQALARIREGADVVLLDLEMPDGDGFSVLQGLPSTGCAPTVIVITAHGSVDRAVRAMRAGAYDFLEKPFDAAVVEEAVGRAAERSALLRVNRSLQADQASGLVYDPAGPLAQAVETCRKAASSDASVLLLGESGTGKEEFARAIHGWSARREGPYVAVNCAALTESLLESELFGHEKGAFTGADRRREGKLEAAHGGTLFLDEVGDTTPGFQVKLLRVLQERSFQRVGGQDTVSVDLRVVAATNRDLKDAVESGDFREDLYYRLNVIALELPPLRSRRGDIRPLADHFLARYAAQIGRPGLRWSDTALSALLAHDWPGNVRELRNAVERAAVLGEGPELGLDELAPEVIGAAGEALGEGFHARIEVYRRQVIEEALAATDGHQTRAAERLRLQRTYLSRLIRKYGIGRG